MTLTSSSGISNVNFIVDIITVFLNDGMPINVFFNDKHDTFAIVFSVLPVHLLHLTYVLIICYVII